MRRFGFFRVLRALAVGVFILGSALGYLLRNDLPQRKKEVTTCIIVALCAIGSVPIIDYTEKYRRSREITKSHRLFIDL